MRPLDLAARRMSPHRQLRDRRARPRPQPGLYSAEADLPWRDAARRHWPEYLAEAGLVALLVIGLGAATTWTSGPGAAAAITALATALICSPLGRRSGAHMNPALTLAYFRLAKIAPFDLAGYLLAQVAGALLGGLAWRAIAGSATTPLAIGAPRPDGSGLLLAFTLDVAGAALVMLVVLLCTNLSALQRWTGALVGLVLGASIVFLAPLTGLALNPARALAGTLLGATWAQAWPAIVAPVLGALLGAEAYRALWPAGPVLCGKLAHNQTGRCIFRCQHPDQARALAREVLMRDVPQDTQ